MVQDSKNDKKKHLDTRRSFVKKVAAGVALPLILPLGSAGGYAINSKVRHASIGVQGMGGYDNREISKSPHVEIVALCDIDDGHLDKSSKIHPKAKRYNDFRIMFEKESR